jgi:uncharacterized protein YndB with AHSA1/START domain
MTSESRSTADVIRQETTIERTYEATPGEIWELWTTREGIEAWWGPEGFTVTVHELDLRPGGVLRYAMTATGPEQVRFMEQAGMPLTTETSITYTEVDAPRRLAYLNLADFVPGVAPYEVETALELHPEGARVRMTLTLEAMHDDEWTERALLGWESELGKLERLLAARARS